MFLVATCLKLVYLTQQLGLCWTGNQGWLGLSILCFLAALCGLLPPRLHRPVLFAMAMALSFLFLSDLVYWRFFGDLLSVPVLAEAWQAPQVGSAIAELLRLRDLLFFADLPLWLLLFFIGKRDWKRAPRHRLVSVSLVVLTLGASAALYHRIFTNKAESLAAQFTGKTFAGDLGILGYHFYDLKATVAELFSPRVVSHLEVRAMHKWFANQARAETSRPCDPQVPFGIASGKNILIIQFEALQPDLIGARLGQQEITPTLNRFAGENLVFDYFFDQTHTGRSSDADFSVYNSLFPAARGAVVNRFATADLLAAPFVLAKKGYHTFAAVGMDGAFWNMAWMQKRYGFQVQHYENALPRERRFCLGLSDRDFFDQALPMLQALPRPFFAHLMTLSSHFPHTCFPQDQRTLALNKLGGTLAGNYLESFHYSDAALGAFFDALKARGLYKDLLILIYGDHDAYLPPDQLALLSFPAARPWPFKALDRVFLGIHFPGGKIKGHRKTVGGHLDIAPTLLHLAGVPRAGTFFLGHNLFKEKPGRVIAFRDGSFVDQKCVFSADGTARSLGTGLPIPAAVCTASRNEARLRLSYSDHILEGNLIPRLRQLEEKQ